MTSLSCDSGDDTDLTPRTDAAPKFHSWIPLFCRIDEKQIRGFSAAGRRETNVLSLCLMKLC